MSNYSGFPESVAARFVDQSGDLLGTHLEGDIFLSIAYVRLECYSSSGTDQENVTGKVS